MRSDVDEWKPIGTAPRDGTRILVAVYSTEQGPAEVDVVRWGATRTAGECWIASDSDGDNAVIYEDPELMGWMPMPDVLPRLRSTQPDRVAKGEPTEGEGSGI